MSYVEPDIIDCIPMEFLANQIWVEVTNSTANAKHGSTAQTGSAKVKNEREQHLGQGYHDIQPLESRHLRQYRKPRIPVSGITTSSLGIAISTSQGRLPSSTLLEILRYPLLGFAISPSSKGQTWTKRATFVY
ncbi:hypothetical protein Golax_001063 [Gossypium laxum]|uniref:Uncharacterized protein n=1 Tax=Gossypium laxum TaxID=34288 RepID=A0A7J9AVK4_9ROSI|nr:hypothetical protein [Gossypium laxum]